MNQNDDTFYIKARRCLRCGGILTSEKAVKDGYGCTCKKKAEQERLRREFEKKYQLSLFDGVN